MHVKKISKLQAVRDQIDGAIHLFFMDSNPVSVHTLASASFTVLKDLAKKNKIKNDLLSEIELRIKPEGKKEFWNKMNEAANFFKHADYDQVDHLEFNELTNDMKLLLCVNSYSNLETKISKEMQTFFGWMILTNPGLFKLSEDLNRQLQTILEDYKFNKMERNQQLKYGKLLFDIFKQR